jgi:hypothetical protein
MFTIVFSSLAEHDYAGLDPAVRERIANALERLRTNPIRQPNSKPLTGQYTGHYRYRSGRLAHHLSNQSSSAPDHHRSDGHRRKIYE